MILELQKILYYNSSHGGATIFFELGIVHY